MLFGQPVWLTPPSLEFLASRQGLQLPATLRPEPYWRTDEELAELASQAHAELGEQNLLDRSAPSIELVIALRALCAGEEECYAYIGNRTALSRMHAAAIGNDRVVAQYTEGADRVMMRDVMADTLAHEIVDGVAECPPARDQAITCAVRELTAPDDSIAIERTLTRAARRMKELHDQAKRLAETKIITAVRDRSGRRHTNNDHAPVVLDVEPGQRWIVYLTGSEGDRYLNARPADRATIIEQVGRELSGLTAATTG